MSFVFRDHLDQLKRLQDAARDGSDPLAAPPTDAEQLELAEVIPDELVDAILDGEIDPQDEAQARQLVSKDEQAAARLDSTQRMLAALKDADRSVECPDFSAAILAKVSSRRGLFSRRGLRRVLAYRSAAALLLLAGIAGLYTAQRISPDVVRLTPQPAPVSQVVEAMPTETAAMVSTVRGAVESLRNIVSPAPVPESYRTLMAKDRVSSCDWVPETNPRLAAALWVDAQPEACSSRCRLTGRQTEWIFDREVFASGGPSIRPMLLVNDRRVSDTSDVVLVRFGR